MAKDKHLLILLMATLCAVTTYGKKDGIFRCHYFLSSHFDEDVFQTEVTATKGEKPVSFIVTPYSPSDTVSWHKCEVTIRDGLRDEAIYTYAGKGEPLEPGWCETTTEKVHDRFYRKLDKGYSQSDHVMHRDYRPPGSRLIIQVLIPEAHAVYRQLVKELPSALTEKDKQSLREHQIPVVFLGNDVDEKGRTIYWALSACKSLQGVISKETFERIAAIMKRTRFPKTKWLKKKYCYGDFEILQIYNESGTDRWNDAMIGRGNKLCK